MSKKILSEINKLEKRCAKYNPDGAWYNYGFGGKDLEHPIYHDEGRYIEVSGYVNAPSVTKGLVEINQLERGLEKLLNNIKKALSKGANYANLGWRIDDLDTILNPTFLDTNDQFKDYERWEKKWKQENNTQRNPNKEEIIKNYK